MFLNDILDQYKDMIANPSICDIEMRLWRNNWVQKPPTERPKTLAAAVKICDDTRFPNIFKLLQIACTLPVTSCESERSFSAMEKQD
jgi:hypothetical protein